MKSSLTLNQIAHHLGGELHGDGEIRITHISTLAAAKSGSISFFTHDKYRDELLMTQASGVLIAAQHLECWQQNQSVAAIVLDNPYLGYAKLAQLLDTTPQQSSGIHPTAVIDETASVADTAAIGAHVVIGAAAQIADEVAIGANCVIGERVSIGRGSRLWSNVTIYHDVHLGEDCLLQAGCVIGSDGFGYAQDGGSWVKIPQLGGVRIGDRVEIGANTCIDRGAINHTIVGDGVIIDNLCQIAHNVIIGENSAMAGQSGIAGSSVIGEACTLAGQSGVSGHIQLADGVTVAANTVITNDIKQSGMYSACIAGVAANDWRRTHARLRQLDQNHQRLRRCEQQLKSLSKNEGIE